MRGIGGVDLRRLGRWVAVAMVLGCGASIARAGLFDQGLSDEHAGAIQRLAVVSLLGDTLHGRKVGLTVFQNDSFDADVASWHIDAAAAQTLQSIAQDDTRLRHVEVLTPDTATLAASYQGDAAREEFDAKALLAFASAQGFDAVLVVQRSWNENEPFVMPGLTLLNRRMPGLNRTTPCIGGYARLLDARSGKSLAHGGGGETCSTRSIDAPWRKSWPAYSPEEQTQVEAAFKAAVDRWIRMALTDMRIGLVAGAGGH
jgi:hypothetical protein